MVNEEKTVWDVNYYRFGSRRTEFLKEWEEKAQR